jgi:TM2 domain-containing membrane protein YozV
VAAVAAQARPVKKVKRKSPVFASALSLVPGLGQLYAGRFVRGIVFFATAGAIAEASFLTPLLAAFLYVFNLYDAFRLAENRNERASSGSVTDRADDGLFTLVGLGVLAVTFLQMGGMHSADPSTAVPLLGVATGLWLANQSRA